MKFSFIDGSVWIIAFLATIVLNTEIGLAVAVLYLLLTLAIRSNQESVSELNQEGIDIFFFLHKFTLFSEQGLHGLELDSQSRKMVLRLEGNISFLSKSLSAKIGHQAEDLLIDASGLGSIDFAGFDSLKGELKRSSCKRILVCTTKNKTMKIFEESGLNVSKSSRRLYSFCDFRLSLCRQLPME